MKRYEAGDLIFNYEDLPTMFYLIKSGSVRLFDKKIVTTKKEKITSAHITKVEGE